jgi:DNA integrity scanning protein DisA with diadenylate cyclase activity
MKLNEKLITAKARRIIRAMSDLQCDHYTQADKIICDYQEGKINENRAIKQLSKIKASEELISERMSNIATKYFGFTNTTKYRYVLDYVNQFI